jgi:hypothetical protein
MWFFSIDLESIKLIHLKVPKRSRSRHPVTKSTFRTKRSKLAIILLSPLLVFVFIAGWSLYCIGQPWQHVKQTQSPTNQTSPRQDNIELLAIPQQEEQVQAN